MKNFIFISFLITFSIYVLGQWSNDPSSNNPISLASGEQALPLVATSENGTSYIAWFSNETGNYNVMLQKLDVFGNNQWDSTGLLISNHEAMSWLPDWDMTIDQEDFAILTFQDVRNGNNNIYAYRISPEGEFIWGDDGLALSNSADFDAAPKVIVTNAGDVVVAWSPENEVVIMQKITPDGTLLWGESGITLSGDNRYSWPQLIAVGDDDVIIKFFEDSGQILYPTRHILAQRYDANGDPVWDEVAVITDAGGISGFTRTFSFINDGQDGFYIAWHDDRDMNNLSSIFVQHIASDGSVQLTDNGVEVSLMANRNHFYAHLALPPGGTDIFVYWNEMDGDQNNRGIYGQKISAAGERLWTDNGKSFIEISSTNVSPVAALNSDEDMVVFYEEYTTVMNAGIKAMRIDTAGNYMWEDEKIDLCTVQSEKVHSVAGSFYNDQWIATWEDSRNGAKDIYAQNIQLDGSLGPIVFPTELTISPDTVFCDVYWGNYVYIINNTTDEVTIENIYFELGVYAEFPELPPFPYDLGVNDTLVVEIWVFPGSDYYNPNGYEYDDMYILTENVDYTVVVAINWDLFGAIGETNKNNKILSAAPNPAKDYVTFSLVLVQVLDCEFIIFDSFGKKIKSFTLETMGSFSWDLKDENGQKVPPGTYFYMFNSDTYYDSGKIILIE